jgi:hypothetical protein
MYLLQGLIICAVVAGSAQGLLALRAYPRRNLIRRQERLMRSIILSLAALLASAIPVKADCPAGRVSSCYRLSGKIGCGCYRQEQSIAATQSSAARCSAAATDAPPSESGFAAGESFPER